MREKIRKPSACFRRLEALGKIWPPRRCCKPRRIDLGGLSHPPDKKGGEETAKETKTGGWKERRRFERNAVRESWEGGSPPPPSPPPPLFFALLSYRNSVFSMYCV